MSRLLGIGVLALCLLVPVVQAGPWLQPRGDAAATGFQAEEGPSWPEVALNVQLPGSMKAEAAAPPLILEDRVLFLARGAGDQFDNTYQVYALDLEDGNLTIVAEDLTRASRLSMATDGETLFVSDEGEVHAIPIEPGGNEWVWPPQGADADEPPADVEMEACWRMVLEGSHLTVLCEARDPAARVLEDPPEGVPESQGGTNLPDILVARLDTSTGEPAWVWTPSSLPSPERLEQREAFWFPVGLAVSESRVVTQVLEFSAAFAAGNLGGQVRHWVWALDRTPEVSDGVVNWAWQSQTRNVTAFPFGPGFPEVGEAIDPGGNPAVTADSVFVKAGDLFRINLGTGDVLWSTELGEADFQTGPGLSTGVAIDGEHVYTTSAQTVYQASQGNPESGWSTGLDFAAGQEFQLEPVVTDSALYISTRNTEGIEEIYAFGTERGENLWPHAVANRVNAFSVGQGVIAYADVEFLEDGNVNTTFVVLGRTQASPLAEAAVPTSYPAPGEPVEADLSASQEGLQGPITRYAAQWGDGTETPWQADPVVNHTYNTTGDVEARFIVGNEAGQTASTTHTFHVGQEPPTEPNLVETAFARENQDLTFGILGILVAVTGGAIGVTSRYRKRSRLQDELTALEQGFEETRARPTECEALLDNRKARARSLALDGQLEEGQMAIIEDRAEDLRRELRTGAVEEEFGFLPHALVVKARKMLEDGQVTELEAEAFLAALEEAEFLRDEQRVLVRERIEDWFGRDAGGSLDA